MIVDFEEVVNLERQDFKTYTNLFVQRSPRYAVKLPGRTWTTKNKPLADRPVEAHIAGQYSIAGLGKWYPDHALLDFDSRDIKDVDRIRDLLHLDENNSMLFTSESPDSYHLFFHPEYNQKPPTIKLLGEVFKDFAQAQGIEVYPQSGHPVRLPFGPKQVLLDIEYSRRLDLDWSDELYWFQQLNAFDISTVHGQQYSFDLSFPHKPAVPSILAEADELLRDGLQCPGSRYDSEWKIAYLFWRKNLPKDVAEEMTFKWICQKSNGFSKDIIEHPDDVRKEIQRQVEHIYTTYEVSNVYPDSTHNLHHGYISKADLELVVKIAKGSLPRMRFLFHLIKFYYPRRYRSFVNVHRDRLVEWSNTEVYLTRLQELEGMGILKRDPRYSTGWKGKAPFAKSIKLEWPWKSSADAVLYDGRSVNTFEDSIKMIFKPGEFRSMLETVGSSRQKIDYSIKGIWEIGKKTEHI